MTIKTQIAFHAHVVKLTLSSLVKVSSAQIMWIHYENLTIAVAMHPNCTLPITKGQNISIFLIKIRLKVLMQALVRQRQITVQIRRFFLPLPASGVAIAGEADICFDIFSVLKVVTRVQEIEVVAILGSFAWDVICDQIELLWGVSSKRYVSVHGLDHPVRAPPPLIILTTLPIRKTVSQRHHQLRLEPFHLVLKTLDLLL